MTVSIGNVAVFVGDLERSTAFYTEALGLEVVARVETPRYREVILSGEGGSQLMLATDAEATGPVLPSGIWKVYLATDDAPGLFRRAVEAGATPVAEPTLLEQFGITIAVVADPDGYLVELGQRHPR